MVRRDVLVVLAALSGLALGLACEVSERFSCQSDVQCVTDEVQGQCEVEGVCSFPDLGCDSGRRYGEGSGELAGMCVGEGGTGSSGGSGTVADSGTGTGTGSTSESDGSGSGPVDLPPATTGPSGDDPYGPCTDDSDCIHPDAVCLPVGPSFVCAPPCSIPSYPSEECPLDPSMLALPECVDLGDDTRCALSCLETMECPDGMTCEFLMDQAYCIWG